MNRRDARNLIVGGIKLLGGVGVAKIIRNITPYEGPFGTIACYVAGALITTASIDLMDAQILKYEQVLKNIAEGDKFVVV